MSLHEIIQLTQQHLEIHKAAMVENPCREMDAAIAEQRLYYLNRCLAKQHKPNLIAEWILRTDRDRKLDKYNGNHSSAAYNRVKLDAYVDAFNSISKTLKAVYIRGKYETFPSVQLFQAPPAA